MVPQRKAVFSVRSAQLKPTEGSFGTEERKSELQETLYSNMDSSRGQDTWVRRNNMERNRHEWQFNEFGGDHGFLRNSEHGDLVVSCLWIGSRHRDDHDLSSRRLAKGARIGQVGFVRAAFLRSATRSFRH